MLYGHVLYKSQNPIPDNSDYCVLRVSQSGDGFPKELYARFHDGTEKRLTGDGTGGLPPVDNGIVIATKSPDFIPTIEWGGNLNGVTTISGGNTYYTRFQNVPKLWLENTTLIATGTTGTNKISGAGNYFEYIPSQSILFIGQTSGAEADTIIGANSVIIANGGSVDPTVVYSGSFVNLFGVNYTNGFISSSVLLGNHSGVGSVINASMLGGANVMNGIAVNNSLLNIDNATFQNSGSSGVYYSTIVSTNDHYNKSNDPAINYNSRYSFITGNSNTYSGLYQTLAIGKGNNTTGLLRGYILVGENNNVTLSGTLSSQYSFILGSNNTINATAIRKGMFLIGDGIQATDSSTTFVMGTNNINADNCVNTIVLGSGFNVGKLQHSLIVSNEISFGNGAGTYHGVIALGVGSAQAISYTAGSVSAPDENTAYFENIKQVRPGGKITLVRPNSSAEQEITATNDGTLINNTQTLLQSSSVATEVITPDTTITVVIAGVSYKLAALQL